MKRTAKCLGAIAIILISASVVASQWRPTDDVATISFPLKRTAELDPGRKYPETIVYVVNYSDLITQIALQPGAPLDDPTPEALSSALSLVINQRLLHHAVSSDFRIRAFWPSDEEHRRMIVDIASRFPSRTEFEERLTKASLGPSSSACLRIVLTYRWRIDKYIAEHLRARATVTPEDEERYYEEVFKPEFRRRSPGLIIPTLEYQRSKIHPILVEEQMDAILKDELARLRSEATINILPPYGKNN